jgi:cell division protein FtsI (penicillin-binding protein 3)/stage V sporulation protein D (sporulation-specific penicillin-binding protein)
VLENSINTGSVFVQQELGNKNFLNFLEKFGLFEKTGIDLQGEEFSYNENLRNGYPRDFATASFGQGIEITPIQLIRAFGAIANGGSLMRPYVVEKISKNGEEKIIEPEVQEIVISEKTSAKLSSMLVNVIENRYAKRAKIEGYYIAGKTGTAQIPRPEGGYFEDKTIQSFIGYFPAMNPQALVLVKLDNPKDVSTAEYSAAPTFHKIAKYIIDYWQILPDYQG